MSISFSGSIALSRAALAFELMPSFMRLKNPTRASLLAEAVLLVALAELIIRQPQELSRFLLLVAGPLQGVLAQPGFEGVDPIGQRRARVVDEALARAGRRDVGFGRQRGVDVARPERVSLRHVDRALDDVLQLADVSGEVVVREPIERLGRDLLDGDPGDLLTEARQEV